MPEPGGDWSRRRMLRTLAVTSSGAAFAGAGAGYWWGAHAARGDASALLDPVNSGPDAGTPGTAGFALDAHRFGSDGAGQVAGYAAATSVEIGDSLDFHVSVAPAQPYRVQVYRLGHYGGAGARLAAASPWLPGITQASPAVQPGTRTVSCAWSPGWRLHTGPSWASGYHLALLTNAAGYARWVPFVVRDLRRPAAGLVVVPTSTYQAYNTWPDGQRAGASLYHGFTGGRCDVTRRSLAVSHDRPYGGTGLPALADRDIAFVQWLDQWLGRDGPEVTYASSEDLHTGRVRPERYRALVFCGHDEYWSAGMRATVTAARDAATSLVFLSANTCYWRVRYQPSGAGTADRVISCDKDLRRPTCRAPAATTQWRLAGSPEQQLLGAQYVSMVTGSAPLVVRDPNHWFWAGTGARAGDRIPGVVWGEADQLTPGVPLPRCRERTLLAASPYRCLGERHVQHTQLHRAASGAWVFTAGSLGWTAALHTDGVRDTRVEAATRNLLTRVLGRRPKGARR
jgi:hypothetical protein